MTPNLIFQKRAQLTLDASQPRGRVNVADFNSTHLCIRVQRLCRGIAPERSRLITTKKLESPFRPFPGCCSQLAFTPLPGRCTSPKGARSNI